MIVFVVSRSCLINSYDGLKKKEKKEWEIKNNRKEYKSEKRYPNELVKRSNALSEKTLVSMTLDKELTSAN